MSGIKQNLRICVHDLISQFQKGDAPRFNRGVQRYIKVGSRDQVAGRHVFLQGNNVSFVFELTQDNKNMDQTL